MHTPKPTAKPAKQRKMLYQAPDHRRYRRFAAPLSPELKSSHGAKALPVRSGDTVRIRRGDHKGFEGKITEIDRKNYRIYVEGLTREKVDGTAIFVPVHPSKVVITNLGLDDKWREKILARKKGAKKKAKVAKKPPKEVIPTTEKAAEEKAAIEEKAEQKKPRTRKKKPVKKTTSKKVEKEKREAKAKEKPEVKKARTRQKTTKKPEGGT
jgi:large subunit ribosomal protein L24